MKTTFIIAVSALLFSFTSWSQDYLITNTLPGNDSISFATLQYGRKDFGFGVISSKGKMNWQIPVPGFPLGFGKFNNNVVCFYSVENPENTWAIKEVHAALIDLQKKKITDDRAIYKRKDKTQTDLFVLNDPLGNFACLLVRTSALKGLMGNSAAAAKAKENATTDLTAISLKPNMEPDNTDIKSLALEAVFIAACAGMDQDLYISSFSNDQIVTERFDRNANIKEKLSVPAPTNIKKDLLPLMQFDRSGGNAVDLALACTNITKNNVMLFFRFDFNNQKAYAAREDVLDKNYVKHLEISEGKKQKLSNFKTINRLHPAQIIQTSDKIMVVKEIQGDFQPTGSNAARWYREGAIISFYLKKDLELERNIILDKKFEVFLPLGNGISSELRNGKLYTVTCELSGAGKSTTYLYTINLNDGSMEKKALERETAGPGWVTDPSTVAWFGDHFITPFNTGASFVKLKFKTYLQAENYE